jgi:hypothetical protein
MPVGDRSEKIRVPPGGDHARRPAAAPQGHGMVAPDPRAGHGRRQFVISMPLMMVSLAGQPPGGMGLRYKGVLLSGAHGGASQAEGPGETGPCAHHGR